MTSIREHLDALSILETNQQEVYNTFTARREELRRELYVALVPQCIKLNNELRDLLGDLNESLQRDEVGTLCEASITVAAILNQLAHGYNIPQPPKDS